MNYKLIFPGLPFIYSRHLWQVKLDVEALDFLLGTLVPEDGAGEPIFNISATQQRYF